MENITTKNFTVTFTKKGDVVVATKTKDWKMTFGNMSNYGKVLQFYTNQVTNEELNNMLTEIYYTACNMITDIDLYKTIQDYFTSKITDAKIVEDGEETASTN